MSVAKNKKALRKKLEKLRSQAIANGTPVLTEQQILDKVKKRRSG